MTEYSSQALLSSRLKPSEASSPTQGPCSVDPSILLLSGSSWNPSREGQSLGKRPHPVSMNKLAYKLNSLQIRDPSPWPTAFPSHRSCQSNAPLVFHSWLVCLVGFSSSSSETPIKAHSKPPFCWEKIVNRHEATFNNWRCSFWRAALAPQPKNCQETSKEGTMSATTWPPRFTCLVPHVAGTPLFSRNLKSQVEPNNGKYSTILDIVPKQLVSEYPISRLLTSVSPISSHCCSGFFIECRCSADKHCLTLRLTEHRSGRKTLFGLHSLVPHRGLERALTKASILEETQLVWTFAF